MSVILKIGFVFFLSFSPAVLGAEKDVSFSPYSLYGKIATDPSLDQKLSELPKAPPLSRTKKSYLTYNQYGFDIINDVSFHQSWLIEELVTFAKKALAPLLDVGAGYGGLTHLLAAQGATVIYNDIDERHLLHGLQNLNYDQKSHIYLNTESFPSHMNFPANSLSALILYRVLHFMEPQQITEGFEKASYWLKKGGKIFIVVLAPHHKEYRDRVLPIYDQLWKKGEEWPGKNLKTQDLLPGQAYALPPMLHVMDERPLKKALEKAGFTIEKSDFISLKPFGEEGNRDGKESFGLIAVKN